MSKEDVINYVMTTPGNPNRAVLEGMLDSVAQSGGALRVKIANFNQAEGTITYDKTWQEVHDALESGMDVTYQYPGGMRFRIFNTGSAPDGSVYGVIAETPLGAASTTPTLVLNQVFFTQLTSPDDYLRAVTTISGGGNTGGGDSEHSL